MADQPAAPPTAAAAQPPAEPTTYQQLSPYVDTFTCPEEFADACHELDKRLAAAAQPGERERGRPAIGMEQLERTTAAFHGRTVASWREFGEAYRAEEMAKMLRAIGAFRAAALPGQEDEK